MSDDRTTGDGLLDGVRESDLPQWATDLGLIAGIVLATYVGFAVLGLLTGVSVNAIAGFLQTVTFYAAVYALVALALNLHWGYTGLFNIGVAGFMAVGVYTMAILTAAPDGSPAGLGLPIPIGVVGGMIAAALVGFVAALPALRVRADYFAIVTLGLSEIIRLSLLSGALRSFEIGGTEYGTGGGSGIRYTPVDSVIPWLLERPVFGFVGDQLFALGTILGIQPSVIQGALYTGVLIVFVVAFYLLLTRITYSPFGRLLKAIREDELAARSLGKNTDRTKIIVFMVGCGLMGLAGILWQGSRSLVSPDSFMPIVTFYIFVALIVGGEGSNTGSVIGGFAFAAFLWEGPRFIRTIVRTHADVRAPPTIYDAFVALGGGDPLALVGYMIGTLDEIRFILVGVVLILLMIWRPDGLLGHRKEIAAATDLSRRPTATDGGQTGEEAATTGGETDE
ncbi:branched-chain amino acid ABC transporter permease [Salinadaptatus halalkaliphilus]|uniref:Branched-chain amino acid ABC transporter permease n=1 Tax=Salinadaptatus halalkaliphilus TaxID=2419781 RepID=A0A4S3TGH5_9EURY|nr:branched-chain amino acid ABC transporter permease [Salinadaptatus halalkaliphilus]THE63044.1 branched-chain amino acid ABC transporter permease [Salinadaptatus halalkaliphilus]